MGVNDVVILDAFYILYIWIGSKSSKYKRDMAVKTANLYHFAFPKLGLILFEINQDI